MKKLISVHLIFAFFLLPVLVYLGGSPHEAKAAGGVPSIISYQGRLADSGGNLLGSSSGTTYYFKFSIWNSATVGAGTKVWPTGAPTSVSSTVRSGVFNVNIGDTANGYPDTLDYGFTNPNVYLQVEVSSDNASFETLSPRQRLSSTVFAQVAEAVVGASSTITTLTNINFLGTYATVTSATSTNLFSTNATFANLFANTANLTESGNLFWTQARFDTALAGTTTLNSLTTLRGLTDLISTRSTTTAATTTSFFATTASSSELFASTFNVGSFFQSGLVDCSSEVQTVLYNAATGKFACGLDATGGGGSGQEVNWTFVPNAGDPTTGRIYVSTTTNQVVIGATATTSLAKLEVVGGLKTDNSTTTNATTTNLYASGLASTTELRANIGRFGSLFGDTANLTESGNLFWTQARFDTALAGTTTLNNLAILGGITDLIATRATTTSATTTNFAISGITSSILKTNGSGSLVAAVAGTDYLASAITAIGPGGQTQTGATITFATSSTPFNGLTASTTITGAGNTITFANTLAGLLTVGGGGTGISNPSAAGILLGTYAGGGWQQLATSSLGLSTSDITEGSKLFYTDARADARINATSTLGTLQYLANLINTTTTAATTTNIFSTTASSTNLFSTNATLANLTVGATITGSISGNAGTVTNGVYTTTFNALFDGRLSATTTLPNLTTLLGLTDIIATRATTTNATTTNLYVSGLASTTSLFSNSATIGSLTANTAGLTESGNLFYTDARVNSYIHSSTTIPKTYTANTFTAAQIFDAITRSTTTQATTTSLAVSSITNSLLKTNGSGSLLAAVAGTDYEASLTAGDGLTRTSNDFDCDTASGSVFGCLLSVDWTLFNNKVSTTSIDTIGEVETLWGVSNILVEADIDASSELLSLFDDETGTGNIVFSTLPTLTGFISNASSTIVGNFTITGNSTTTNATTTNLFSTAANFSTLCIAGDCKTEWPTSGTGASTTLLADNNTFTGSNVFNNIARSTTTAATTTNLFATTASTTNLFGTVINGFGLATCSGANFLQWSGGSFGCSTPAGSGDVSAAATFDNDNRLIRSDGTAKGVQASGVTLDDSNNLTGIAQITATNILANGSSTLQNFTFVNATGTQATTTNLFSTTATFTNLYGNTANLTESGNLFYTDTRVNSYIHASTTIPKTYTANTFTAAQIFDAITRSTTTQATSTNFFATTGTLTNLFANTANLTESGNLFWTQARFDTALAATTTLNNLAILRGVTDLIAIRATTTNATTTNLYVSGLASTTSLFSNSATIGSLTANTAGLTESGNLFYTDARVNSYIHSSTTIPKTYTANTFTAAQIFDAITRSTTTQATTTNLFSTTGTFTTLCLTGDACRTTWPTGGASTDKFATSTNGVAIYPNTAAAVVIGATATTTTGAELEVQGDLYVSGSTTLQNFTFRNATGTQATTTNLFSTNATISNLFSNTANLTESGNLFYTDTRVNSYIHSSTTIPKLYTANTFTAAQIFDLITRSTTTAATTTNIFSTTASSTNLFATALTAGNSTLGAVTAGLYNGQTISSTASFTGTLNVTSGLTTLSNLLLSGSSTLQNFTFANATGTNATTTNLYISGLASTTSLRSNSATIGSLTANTAGLTESGNLFYTDARVNSYIHASTTIPKLYTANTFTAAQIFDLITRSTTTAATTTSFYVSGLASTTSLLSNSATIGSLTANTSGLSESGNLFYTDTRVNSYIHASTTIPKTYTANTFTAAQIFESITRSTTTSATTTSFFATTASSTNLFTSSLGIASSSPWAKLSLELNPDDPAMIVANMGSTTPTLYIGGVNQNGFIGIGTTTNFTSLARVTMSQAFVNETGTTNAIAGMFQNFTFAPTTDNISQVGNRLFITVGTGSSATSTSVGQIIRTSDSSGRSNLVRGLEVVSSAGTNTYGVNTGIRTTGGTFGIQAITTGLAGGTSTPAAIYGENTGTTQGDILRLYSASMTSASQFASFYHEGTTFTGNGLTMNFGTGGSFTGNFIDLQRGGSSQFRIDDMGTTTIGQINQTVNAAGLLIPFGSICVDSDGTCTGTTTGYVAARGFLTGATNDLAENFYSSEDLDTGEIVYAKGRSEVGRSSSTSDTIIGVVSTKPGIELGAENKMPNGMKRYAVGLAGRIPVKVSTENGDIKVGDNIVLSSISGVGMKGTRGTIVGIALEAFNGEKYLSEDTVEVETRRELSEPVCTLVPTERDKKAGGGDDSESPSSRLNLPDVIYEERCERETIEIEPENGPAKNAQVGNKAVKVGKVMMFIDLVSQRVSVSGNVEGDIYDHLSFELSTDGLSNKFKIQNIASIASLNGKWSIDEDGNLIAESIKTKKLEVGTQELPMGITIYDTITKQPYCMYMANGIMSSMAGKCGESSAPEPVSEPVSVPEPAPNPEPEPESTPEISSVEAVESEPAPEPAPEPPPVVESSSGGE